VCNERVSTVPCISNRGRVPRDMPKGCRVTYSVKFVDWDAVVVAFKGLPLDLEAGGLEV
jgi:hypothetical protein